MPAERDCAHPSCIHVLALLLRSESESLAAKREVTKVSPVNTAAALLWATGATQGSSVEQNVYTSLQRRLCMHIE